MRTLLFPCIASSWKGVMECRPSAQPLPRFVI
jgi:hypothetical protein